MEEEELSIPRNDTQEDKIEKEEIEEKGKKEEKEEEDGTKKTPPKPTRKSNNNNNNNTCNNNESEGIIPRKWGRLLSLHPSLPHVDLIQDKLSIGRKRDSNLVLKEPTVSSRHCVISLNPSLNQAFIEDLSSNGTFVNGIRVPKGKVCLLENHARISFVVSGGLTYLYEDLILANHLGKEILDDDESGIDRDYTMYEKLGEGAFSTVRLAIHKRTNERRAIKIIDLSRHPNPRAQQHIQREINILMKIDHPNIAKIKDVYLGKRCKVFLVMELAEGGELFDKIAEEGACCEDEARFIFRQLVDAIHYLHNRGIAHRDLKPENILLRTRDAYPQVMITDFGLARILEGNELAQTQCGTPQYVAPEILLLTSFGNVGRGVIPNLGGGGAKGGLHGYGKECDMWSLGGILYVLLSGVPPFREQDTMTGMNLMSRIEQGIFDFPQELWSGVSEEATELVTKLLTVDRAARYTTEQAMSHPWAVQKIERFAVPYPISSSSSSSSSSSAASSSSSSSSSSSPSSNNHSIVSPLLSSTPRISRTPLAPLTPLDLKPPSPLTPVVKKPSSSSDPSPSPSPSPSLSPSSSITSSTPSKMALSHKSKSFTFSKRSFEFDERENSETFNNNSNTPLKKLKLI